MNAPSTRTADAAPERGAALAVYVAGARERALPPAVLDAARRALVDYLGCAVGAAFDAAAAPVRATLPRWQAHGAARVFLGGTTAPALAALANGTMAHAMDYDDTHPAGAGHPSGPCWSAALALAAGTPAPEARALAAFVAGYEVMARLGGGGPPGVGRSLQRRGLHPTAIVGHAGAAATASAMLGLDAERTAHALGAAATMAGGLIGSFGTHGKPFHAGKAAMDGILAAQLAAEGFVASTRLYELGEGWLQAFVQDGAVEVPALDFAHWEIFNNGFKLYASCRATHASTQAARTLAPRVGARRVRRVHARIHPNGLVTAGKRDPRTPLEAKFSIPFCIALGLRGHALVPDDFGPRAFADPAVTQIVPTVELEPVAGQPAHEAHLEVELEDGERLSATTQVVRGVPENPIDEAELRAKFDGLVVPAIGAADARALYACARDFGAGGTFATLDRLLAARTPAETVHAR